MDLNNQINQSREDFTSWPTSVFVLFTTFQSVFNGGETFPSIGSAKSLNFIR